jgi:hypothetical protein
MSSRERIRNTMSARRAKLETSNMKATGSRLIGREVTTFGSSLAVLSVSGFIPFFHM